MKHTVLILVGLTGSAAAESSLTLVPVPAAEPALRLARDEPSCDGTDGRMRVARVTLGTRKVSVLHQCGGTDRNAELAFEGKDGWRIYTSAIIAYQAANMTDAPLHVRLVGEATTFGTLADGHRALVYRTDTLYEDVRRNADHSTTVVASSRQSQIDVCALDSSGEPSCAHTTIACPDSGCARPKLVRGTLSVMTKTGRTKLAVAQPRRTSR